MKPYEQHTIMWEGLALRISWCPEWSTSVQIAHLEISTADAAPLPITETGYRSHFVHRADVESYGGPVAYATAWLDDAARSPDWQRHVESSKQLCLF
jgi:hypothetical protein